MKFLLSFVATLLLTACAIAPNPRYIEGTLSADQGVLVASITRSLEIVGARYPIAMFFVKNQDTGAEFRMTSHDPSPFYAKTQFPASEGQHGRVSVFQLAPGRYEITRWSLFIPHGMGYNSFDSVDFEPVPFEVKKGEITYLCNCHIDVAIGKGALGLPIETDAQPSFLNKSDRDVAYAIEEFPELSGLKVTVPPYLASQTSGARQEEPLPGQYGEEE